MSNEPTSVLDILNLLTIWLHDFIFSLDILTLRHIDSLDIQTIGPVDSFGHYDTDILSFRIVVHHSVYIFNESKKRPYRSVTVKIIFDRS